jgi:hypothetical protein
MDSTFSKSIASGELWFLLTKARNVSKHQLKDMTPGDFCAFGPMGGVGGKENCKIHGVIRVNSHRRGPLRVTPRAVHKNFHDRLNPNMMGHVQEYLASNKIMEYVPFEEVWDLRRLNITFKEFAELLHSRAWKPTPQGMDCLIPNRKYFVPELKNLLEDPLALHRRRTVEIPMKAEKLD